MRVVACSGPPQATATQGLIDLFKRLAIEEVLWKKHLGLIGSSYQNDVANGAIVHLCITHHYEIVSHDHNQQLAEA